MLNPRDMRTQKMIDLLGELGINERDMAQIEDYLSGEQGEEALQNLSGMNLSTAKTDQEVKLSRLFDECINKGRMEEADKLALVLFTIGQATCTKLLGYQYNKLNSLSKGQKIAIYVAKQFTYQFHFFDRMTYCYNSVISIADKNPENIREAVQYFKKGDSFGFFGLICLYTCYFCLKYSNGKVNMPEEKKGLLKGIFGNDKAKENLAGVTIQEEDRELLEDYEKMLVQSIGQIYSGQAAHLVIDEIENAVLRNEVNERILKAAKMNLSINRTMLQCLSACSYVNFMLSNRLWNIVKICAAVDSVAILDVMKGSDLRGMFQSGACDFEQLFDIGPAKLIYFAALKDNRIILAKQLKQNEQIYLAVMEKADYDPGQRMMNVIKEKNPKLYQSMAAKQGSDVQAKIVSKLLSLIPQPEQQEIDKYLKGEVEIDQIYPCMDKLKSSDRISFWNMNNMIVTYRQNYEMSDVCEKCQIVMMLCSKPYFLNSVIWSSNKINGKEIESVFAMAERQKVSLAYQIKILEGLHDSLYRDEAKEELLEKGTEIFQNYLSARRAEMTDAFHNAGSIGRYFGLRVFAKNVQENKEDILFYTQDTSKTVKDKLIDVLSGQKGWEAEVSALLESKKAAERELAIRVLTKWDSEKYKPVLEKALEKEKNAKVRALLETVMGVETTAKQTDVLSLEDMVKDLHKGNKKRSLAWAYETPFSKVHQKNGVEASEEYLQAILLSYSAMGGCGVSQTAAALAKELDEAELAVYVNELFDKWMEAGAESKKRWVLYASSIHGGDDIVKKLHHNIQEWPQVSRGAIAAEAVQALALNPLPQALLIVDGISRKFKFKQVRAAAGKALQFAAEQLGITTEELADRIVPNLGFDDNMERIFDYGERKFTVTITTALEIEVFDEQGKKLKNLPAPGKRDDEVKAAAAYEEFKQMKKQMKTTVSSQKQRLEMALSTSRQWTVGAWRDLFVKNPIMHQFAIGLIWGTYEENRLMKSFRYMEDGSFNTEDEEEFELPQDAKIGLVHPIELSEQSLSDWKQQMEDYEIIQPIEQLLRKVFYRTEEEMNQKSIERFGGYILNDLSLSGKLTTLGWYRGSVVDGGGFYTYYREDTELGLGVELHFSGSYVGGGNEDVTVYDARFYKAGTITRGSYTYDEADEQKAIELKDIPERYFSEIVLQLSKATASSQEQNKDWKSQRN